MKEKFTLQNKELQYARLDANLSAMAILCVLLTIFALQIKTATPNFSTIFATFAMVLVFLVFKRIYDLAKLKKEILAEREKK
jgi:hypothetical protein